MAERLSGVSVSPYRRLSQTNCSLLSRSRERSPFIQRFGSALQLNLHFHVICLEGVSLDRTTQGLTPRLVPGEPPTDMDIAAVVQKISRRVLRLLRRLGYLETDMEPPVATGYDPLRETAPELARTMAASVQQRLAFGDRAG